MNNLKSYLEERRKMVNSTLENILPSTRVKPSVIHKAMRYSLFIGGKRIRPILCLAACEAIGGRIADALEPACALELIHTYSLVHDDLPCMDDDDLRRGKPTNHKIFGEGIAVLAGDALLTLAFEILAKHSAGLVQLVARAAGSRNLIGGQVEDLLGENKKISLGLLRFIHLAKTAALIQASIHAGAWIGGASPTAVKNMQAYGRDIGLAFQVADDILDVSGDEKKMGKRTRKDAELHKATYPSILGLGKSRAHLHRLTVSANNHIRSLGPKADPLRKIAHYLASRNA